MRLQYTRKVSIDFSGSARDAVERLRPVVKESGWQCYVSGGLVGSVSVEEVTLFRKRPGLHYPAPMFVGHWEQIAGGTRLVGEIATSKDVKALFSLLFCFAVLLFVGVGYRAVTAQLSMRGFADVACALFFIVAIAFVIIKSSVKLGTADAEFICRELSNILTQQQTREDITQ